MSYFALGNSGVQNPKPPKRRKKRRATSSCSIKCRSKSVSTGKPCKNPARTGRQTCAAHARKRK